MSNIEVKINRRTRKVKPEKIFIGLDGENLQENVIFSFEDEFVEGQARLDIEFRDGTKGQITELKQVGETYVLPIKSEITKYSGCIAQLVIDEGTDENSIPIFKSMYVGLIVAESINAVMPVPEGYTEWIDSANAKLNQIDEKIEEVDTAVEQVNNAVERVDEGLSNLTHANEEAREIVSNFESNVEQYTTDFNTNADNKTNSFNSNYESKLRSFDSNASDKTTTFNDNADSKLSAYNENADSKLSSYNTNASSKLNAYNSNASTKTSEYNTNATSKLNEYNTNAETKLSNYNTNASDKLDSYNSNADSKLDEYNQNASEKIEEYDNHVAEMQNTIDKLEDRVDDLEDNQITLPAEGTNIHVDNAAKARLYEFEMTKESTQDGTPTPDNPVPVNVVEGYRNLFDKSTENVGKFISSSNGSLVSVSAWNTSEYIEVNSNLKYILSAYEVANSQFAFGEYTSNQTFINRIDSTGDRKSFILNLNPNTKYIRVCYRNDKVSKEIQLTEGDQELPYVPYGNNYVDVKVTGKNLNTSDLETGGINSTGENQSNNSYTRSKDYIELQSNIEYTISSTIQAAIGLRYYDKNKNFISSANATAQPKTFTTPENCYYIRYVLTINDLTNLIQIEQGSTATSHEPYKETIVPLPLNGNVIAGIDEYLDEYVVDKSGHCWLNKKTGKVVLIGSEDEGWFIDNSGTPNYSYRIRLIGTVIAQMGLSNNFIRTNITNSNTSEGFDIRNANAKKEIRIRYGIEDTLENFKAWLSTHNTEVYYVLETPELIDLQTTVDLKLFKGVNNITNSEDGNMRIRYVESIESVISELRNAILEIGGGE